MLTGKTAFVTGAGTGIGKAIALELAEQGADIAIQYFGTVAEVTDTVATIQKKGRRAFAYEIDLFADDADVQAIADKVHRDLGKIDILINNVGGPVKRIAFLDSDNAFWHKVFNLNIMAAVSFSRAFLPDRIENGWGRIINTSSIGSKTGGAPKSVHYATMKAGINGFTNALNREVAPFGITVNAVLPGAVETPLLINSPTWDETFIKQNYPVGRMGRVQDIAPMVAFLASDQADFIAGAEIPITGGRY